MEEDTKFNNGSFRRESPSLGASPKASSVGAEGERKITVPKSRLYS